MSPHTFRWFRARAVLRLVPLLALLVCSTASCRYFSSKDDGAAAALAAAKRAHDAYVAAINANKAAAWAAALSDDVVYLVPNREPLVGKAAVGAWVAGYLDENTTHWTKTPQDFTVSGDWAFARYSYDVSDSVIIRDSSVDGGGTANDAGWGLVVYHHDADGTWRVARDAWASSRPAR